MVNNPILGLVDSALDIIQSESEAAKTVQDEKQRKASGLKKITPHKLRIIPSSKINHEEFPEGMDIENAVYVPEQLLRYLNKKVETNTRKFSNAMLKDIVPTVLSYTSGMAYVRAALRDGLNIEIQPEQGVEEAVKYTTYLSVMMHFVKSSKWPLSVKKRFIEHISDQLALKAIDSLLEGNKMQKHSDYISNVQAIVSRRRSGAKDQAEEDKPNIPISSRKRALRSKG